MQDSVLTLTKCCFIEKCIKNNNRVIFLLIYKSFIFYIMLYISFLYFVGSLSFPILRKIIFNYKTNVCVRILLRYLFVFCLFIKEEFFL